MRKLIICIILVSMIGSLCGCATIKKKFTRKKDQEKEAPVYYTEDFEQGLFGFETYRHFYILWKAAQKQLIEELEQAQRGTTNKKALTHLAQDAHLNLLKMKGLLPEQKQAEIGPYILELEDIINQLRERRWSASSAFSMKKKLSLHKRAIETNFSYKKIKDSLVEKD